MDFIRFGDDDSLGRKRAFFKCDCGVQELKSFARTKKESVCSKCNNKKSNKKWLNKNPDYFKEWYLKNDGAEFAKNYRNENKQRFLEYWKDYNNRTQKSKNIIAALPDYIVRDYLRGQGFAEGAIDKNIIDVKREILKIKRICRTSNN